MRKIIILTAIFTFVFSVNAISKPGNESILKNDTYEANVYFIKIYQNDSEVVGYEGILIPEEIEKECLEKTYGECAEKHKGGYKKPTRILKAVIEKNDLKQIDVNVLRKIDNYLENQSKEKISTENMIKLKIKWELWTNGENFSVVPNLKEHNQ